MRVDLEDAVRFHLSVVSSAASYDPDAAGIPADLRQVGPVIPHHWSTRDSAAIALSESEVTDLVQFLHAGLLDDRALSSHLCKLIPASVPSGLPVLTFEGWSGP